MSDIEEKAFFPKQLLSKADIEPGSDEPLWRPRDMEAVIGTFEKVGKVILGLDVFIIEPNRRKVVGYPDFSQELANIPEAAVRVRMSAKMAREFVSTLEASEYMRLTVTWD